MLKPPVEPLTQLLPLNNDPKFGWDQFEEFCTGFLYKLPYVKECHRQGKEGNKQDGIDIIADLNDGRKAVFSCKQYDKFKPSNARKAVKAITYAADEYYLLLSCEASTSVRAIWRNKGANWDVWDTFDISRKIRELPPDSARSLIRQCAIDSVKR
ncbi:MAG: restriction endonuclease [Methanotrichaceae archaeon]